MIGNNHEKDLISLIETLKDTIVIVSYELLYKYINVKPEEANILIKLDFVAKKCLRWHELPWNRSRHFHWHEFALLKSITPNVPTCQPITDPTNHRQGHAIGPKGH